MQFGYFDDKHRDYVITRPDTPRSWSNYLGNTYFGSIITNHAGGYSFYRSGGMGRFIRMRFNSIPMDQPGRYLYIRDMQSGDYWSASWQPTGKPLGLYRSECRHGMGYTRILSEYSDIASDITWFVPLDRTHEVWKVRLTNRGSRKRELRVFSYLEYAANWNAIDDLLNIQYVQYTATMKVHGHIIDHGTNINIPEMPDNFAEKDQGRHSFQVLVGLEPAGYDTDREAFLGPYRTYANPLAVERGSNTNSEGYGDNPCGSLSGNVLLRPGESVEFLVIAGIGRAEAEGAEAAQNYSDISLANLELDRIRDYWAGRMAGFTAETPDPELDSTINIWGIYNALITFAWSRSASLVYSGIDRDGLGYRDSVQDLLGVTHAIPGEVETRLTLLISGQASSGGALPVILPFSHKPGKEPRPAEADYRSDDCLWLFNAIPAYVKETGNMAFYRKIIPYADTGEDSVFGHMKRAIQFNLERSGKHGLPCGLKADWNDCLRFGQDGESVFVALQLRLALREYLEAADLMGDEMEHAWADIRLKQLDDQIMEHAWDGEWFLRGYRADGMKFGSEESSEGQLFLNPQLWSVICGLAKGETAERVLSAVRDRLSTPYGLMICDPPYTSSDYNIVRAQLMNPGLKENGGIFMHTQGWGVMAEAMMGHGDQAYEYLRAYLPAAYNDKAEIREIEPYTLCQSTHSKYSPRQGASRIPWLSGSATWTYYAITQYVLGIRPEYRGLTLDPCIPSRWDRLKIHRRFRGKSLQIMIHNPEGSQYGVAYLLLNGERINGNFIAADMLQEENEIEVIMK